MKRLQFIITLVLMFAFLLAQVGNVAAAPLAQDPTSITGTIISIGPPETDANGVITVPVTLEIAPGTTQIFPLSQADAAGLVVGQTVSIDPLTNTVVPNAPAEEEDVHPISALLAAFFKEDASVIDGYHDDGFGFGVIAQALWISRNLTGTEDQVGDASLTEAILTAKEDKDYETFFKDHPEFLDDFDGTAPTNWGQFKKVLLNKKNNLGVVVSGQADPDETSTQLQALENGNGKGNGQGQGKGNNHGNKGKGHGYGHNKP